MNCKDAIELAYMKLPLASEVDKPDIIYFKDYKDDEGIRRQIVIIFRKQYIREVCVGWEVIDHIHLH